MLFVTEHRVFRSFCLTRLRIRCGCEENVSTVHAQPMRQPTQGLIVDIVFEVSSVGGIFQLRLERRFLQMQGLEVNASEPAWIILSLMLNTCCGSDSLCDLMSSAPSLRLWKPGAGPRKPDILCLTTKEFGVKVEGAVLLPSLSSRSQMSREIKS